jgi:glycine hydroxymethyltransferase
MLLDLRTFKVTGKDAEASLGRANITCNKNGIPFDTQSPMITSGIRLGTPACTTRGFGSNEFNLIADLITKVIQGLSENNSDNSKIEKEVKKEIVDLCSSFPIYSE